MNKGQRLLRKRNVGEKYLFSFGLTCGSIYYVGRTNRQSLGTQQAAHVALTWDNPLLTLRQASQYAICTPRYLQNQIRAGRLKALKPSRKLLRIRRIDLDRFLESGATIGGEA